MTKAAADRWHFLDLAQAAVIAGFAATDTDAVAALVAAEKDGRFDHVAQRMRDDRAEQPCRDVLAQELTAAGIAVVPPSPR